MKQSTQGQLSGAGIPMMIPETAAGAGVERAGAGLRAGTGGGGGGVRRLGA